MPELCEVCGENLKWLRKDPHVCPGKKVVGEESERLLMYWKVKRSNCKKDPGFTLTFEQLEQLVEEAGIVPSQIARTAGGYALGRYGDTGPYEMGNCRFITASQNSTERNTHGGRSDEVCAKAREAYRRKKNKRKKGYACVIDGIEYVSLSEAARAIGVTDFAIGDRIRRANCPNYNWKEE